MIVAGIMSGTSLDGIDVAVVDIGRRIQVLGFHTEPYPNKLRQALLAVSNTNCHTADISRLNFALAELYAKIFKATPESGRAELIGCHGQTIYHEGAGRTPNTLQIGDGCVLAQRTGVPVVSGFRYRDMAAGGQGAPLVPFLDVRMFSHAKRGRVALNLGGIGNITAIPPGAADKAFAFDTGPANMVMDQLITEETNGRMTFDRGGAIAAKGKPNEKVLRDLLRDRYYRLKPPKSAGREEYGAAFIARLRKYNLSFNDLVATATAFTALTVADAIHRFVEPVMPVDDLVAGGGGVRNPQIMGLLAAYLPNTRLTTTAEFGIDPDIKEAVAFALMAYETYHRRPSNVPGATGAKTPAILGRISFI